MTMATGTSEKYEDQRRIADLRHLYRSVTRMSRSEAVDTILNQLVEDIVAATGLERLIVLYFNQQSKHLESRVCYGFEQIQDINIPFSQVNGLLKRAYADREPLNVLKNFAAAGRQGKMAAVKCGIFKDDYPPRAGRNRRRHINICFKGIEQPEELKLAKESFHCKHYSQLTYYQHDRTVESLFGGTGAFLIIPICDDQNFYGYLLADKNGDQTPVGYNEARLASAMVAHAAMAIGRALKHHEMLTRIARQNQELNHHLEEIEELKSFYESIFQGLRSGLITADRNLKITQSNKAASNLLGYAESELHGRPLIDLFKGQEKEVQSIFARGGKCIDPRTGYLSEFTITRKDGSRLPVEVCFSTINDKNGKIAGLSCIFLDITQRKKMEKHLARMDRLASLGELASGIAHEIRNPLAGIAGALQIISKQFDENDGNREIFREVFNQVKRLDKFVQSLLQFARPSTPKFEPLEIGDIIDSTLFLVASQISKKNIILSVSHGRRQPLIQGDRGLLQQALLNIIINALDAMPAGGALTIDTTWQETPPAEAAYCSPGEEMVTISISDTGPGIRQEDRENIFNPFFTTKSQGTGLGLAITHRIVEQHNGTIFVDSKPGAGTTFTISLPVESERKES